MHMYSSLFYWDTLRLLNTNIILLSLISYFWFTSWLVRSVFTSIGGWCFYRGIPHHRKLLDGGSGASKLAPVATSPEDPAAPSVPAETVTSTSTSTTTINNTQSSCSTVVLRRPSITTLVSHTHSLLCCAVLFVYCYTPRSVLCPFPICLSFIYL